LKPVFGSTRATLKSSTTVWPVPAFSVLGVPVDITTSAPLGTEPEGTVTVAVAPFADPVTVPPDPVTGCAVTAVMNPAPTADGGGPSGL
jgi:hypothetical protein